MNSESKDGAGQMSESEVENAEARKTKKRNGKTAPKTTVETWERVKLEYVTGHYRSITELSDQYGINQKTLWTRLTRENWELERESNLRKLQLKVTETKENETESWLQRVKERGRKDWSIVDSSMDNLGGEIDPEGLGAFVRARKTIDDMVRRALGLRDEVDVTTGGKSIGESFLSVMEKLRGKPALTDEELGRVVDVEIVETNS